MQILKQIPDFHKSLADWYQANHRPLPWRTHPSLYRTVVSELMLQQTQIKTMLPYFERWMERFPDFQALADAPTDAVLKHWEGLGYYSRARNLHKLAKAILQLPSKPATPKEWQALPGIGPYTAAAITSIAQDYPAAVIDGNVVRILARLTNDTRTFKNNGAAVKAFTPLAAEVLNKQTPGDHNQAMMELGATLCTKQKPNCPACPVRSFCATKDTDPLHTISIPRIERTAIHKIAIDRALVNKEDKILLHRIADDAPQLAGQYELPTVQALGLKIPDAQPLAVKKRGITNKRITETIYQITPPINFKKPQAHEWIQVQKIDSLTLSGPHRRWLNEMLKTVEIS